MLKKMFLKKILLATALLFTLFLLCVIPSHSAALNITEEVTYLDNNMAVIYLLDENDYLGRTKIVVSSNDINIKAKELLEALIKGHNENIPSGFKSIISSDTKINSIKYDNGLIKVDFSKELLDTTAKYEEKIIEAIVYTLTSIPEVEDIIIYVDGEILTKLPQSKLNLPSTLNRTFGINKEYSLNDYKNSSKVTIYYSNPSGYYIPVTKYLNTKDEKIKVIIDELASTNTYNSHLISYLNSNTTLLTSELYDDTLYLVFNEFIFNDLDTNNILEEVVYSISLSVKDNYNVSQIVFKVHDQEIYKSVMKTLEN